MRTLTFILHNYCQVIDFYFDLCFSVVLRVRLSLGIFFSSKNSIRNANKFLNVFLSINKNIFFLMKL